MNEELTFISSNGTLVVDSKGTINNELSDLSDWLNDIGKVDIDELDNYALLMGINPIDSGDVLDFGYWDKKGKYVEPDRWWREQVFHNIYFTKEKNEQIIEKSYDWINQNRGIKQ